MTTSPILVNLFRWCIAVAVAYAGSWSIVDLSARTSGVGRIQAMLVGVTLLSTVPWIAPLKGWTFLRGMGIWVGFVVGVLMCILFLLLYIGAHKAVSHSAM